MPNDSGFSEKLSGNDLEHALGRDTLAKGRRVRAGGAVRSLEVTADGMHFSASVRSEQKGYGQCAPYQQTVSLSERSGRLHVIGYCTCPVAHNCKHVAAALLEHLARTKRHGTSARGALPGLRVKSAIAKQATKPLAVQSSHPAQPMHEARPSAIELSENVAAWLEHLWRALDGEVHEPCETKPNTGNQRTLHYVLQPPDAKFAILANHAVVRPVSVHVSKNGALSGARPYAPGNVLRPTNQQARYLTSEDLRILADLHWLQRTRGSFSDTDTDTDTDHDTALPANTSGRYVLEALLATGRLHWGKIDGPVLSVGPQLAAEPRWTTDAIGRQKLALLPAGDLLSPAFDAVLPLSPLTYVDSGRGLIGPLATALPEALAIEVVRAPAINHGEAALVAAIMRTRLTPQKAASRPMGGAVASGRNRASAESDPVEAAKDAPEPETAMLLPLPESAETVEIRTIAPVPCLRLAVADVRLAPQYGYYVSYRDLRHFSGTFRMPVAEPAFDYAGERIAAGDPRPRLEHRDGDTLVVTPRDTAAELKSLQLLRTFGLAEMAETPLVLVTPTPGTLFLNPDDDLDTFDQLESLDHPDRFIDFAMHPLRRLKFAGWQITFSDEYPYRMADGKVDIWADVGDDSGDDSGIDWFSFEVGIEFEGQRINLVAMLSNILPQLPRTVGGEDGKRQLEDALADVTLLQELPDGRLLPIPGVRLAPLVQGLLELVGPRRDMIKAGKVRLNRAEAPALAEFATTSGTDIAFAESAARLIDLGRTLQNGRPSKAIKPPKSFKAKLRPYQAHGLAWMDFLREAGFGGILADDMGLGKTVQALAFLAREKAAGRLDKPALIVAPTSVLPNWMAEGGRFVPNLRMLALRGPDRQMRFSEIAAHDIVLSTYPLLPRDAGTLLEHEFHVAILDEAQAIKNPKAAVSKTVHQIKARHRLALTGTPLENNLGEVWSLFQFLSPGLLGDTTTFRRLFRTPIEKHGDAAAQAFLSKRLKPFMLRRTKEQVAPELPKKTEITELVRLEGGQRDLYETVRVLMEKRVREEIDRKGLAKSHIVFLDALLKLRQVCCDPRLLKMAQATRVKESAKLGRLMEMLPEMLAEGRRILLFSQFTSMLALIEAELDARRIAYVKLTGQTQDRAEPVARFQSGEVPLFLISLKAGGTGLNLTAADTVIHYDPWWNPAVERQATDRAYRIGQDKPVFAYRLIVEEGIEQAIELLKARKAALADALFEGSARKLGDLTEADVSALFAPLSAAARPPRRKAA